MDKLQEFMLLFRMEPTQTQPTPAQLAEMQQQWGSFIGGMAAQARLVSTSRLGFDGRLIDASMQVQPGIRMAGTETLTGNMVIKAASLEEATELAKGCPVLMAGGSVELRTVIPMQS